MPNKGVPYTGPRRMKRLHRALHYTDPPYRNTWTLCFYYTLCWHTAPPHLTGPSADTTAVSLSHTLRFSAQSWRLPWFCRTNRTHTRPFQPLVRPWHQRRWRIGSDLYMTQGHPVSDRRSSAWERLMWGGADRDWLEPGGVGWIDWCSFCCGKDLPWGTLRVWSFSSFFLWKLFVWVPYYDAINSLVTIKFSRGRRSNSGDIWKWKKLKWKRITWCLNFLDSTWGLGLVKWDAGNTISSVSPSNSKRPSGLLLLWL